MAGSRRRASNTISDKVAKFLAILFLKRVSRNAERKIRAEVEGIIEHVEKYEAGTFAINYEIEMDNDIVLALKEMLENE